MAKSELRILNSVLQDVQPSLFDYCMRMTGDVMKASALVDEASRSLAEMLSGGGHMADSNDFRLLLFREARLKGGDSWYADTSLLQNPSLQRDSNPAQATLDMVLRQLSGKEREAILLVERFSFKPADASQIAGMELEDFDAFLALAWQKILTRLPPGAVPVAAAGRASPIELLPNHPFPGIEREPVTNLSEIMSELESTRRGSGFFRRIALTLVIAGVVAAVWYFV
jgi:DNA-directed RNA polymerase specialized sigma24 family protein